MSALKSAAKARQKPPPIETPPPEEKEAEDAAAKDSTSSASQPPSPYRIPNSVLYNSAIKALRRCQPLPPVVHAPSAGQLTPIPRAAGRSGNSRRPRCSSSLSSRCSGSTTAPSSSSEPIVPSFTPRRPPPWPARTRWAAPSAGWPRLSRCVLDSSPPCRRTPHVLPPLPAETKRRVCHAGDPGRRLAQPSRASAGSHGRAQLLGHGASASLQPAPHHGQ